MTPDDPRPHLAVSVPRLADLPLDEIDATVARTRTTGEVVYAASIETWTPSIAGWTPGESLVLPFPLTHEALEADASRVRFEWDGRTLRAQVAWAQGTDAFGLGEQVGGLRRNGRSYLLWNSDAWCYGEQTPALYQSHPFVLALKPDGGALGIIVDSPARATALVADDGVEFAVEGEPCVVHLIDADAPAEVLKALAAMIGTAARPPRWALGYHQCRWSYENESEVREVATRLRAERVPCDAIWFDIDYMDRWRVFTWNEERFGDPRGLIEELEDQGFHSVAIIDPGIAVAGDNPACVSGLAGRHFLEDASGQPVQGRVWPGVCHFPDFTRGSTRAWWASLVKELVEESGLHGLWNDMNEPSVFRTPARTLPDDTRHRGLGGGDHVKFHNLYGQLMCEATLAGVRAARPDARPFVLTRAAHLASGRLAATWTGDNMSRWEDLRWAVPMVLSLGLSGQPFSGPDLGGFYGDPDEELFVRWFEVGALLPFCRGHSEKTSCRKEPWSFGKAPLAHVRANLERRMRLLPVFVTLFEEAHRTGLPICRPLWMLDPELRAIDDAFALGTDLIAAPVLEPGVTSREVPLPASAGSWFVHAGDGTRLEGASARIDAPLGTCPLLARGGSVIVEGATRLHTGEPDTERLWHVYLDGNGRAEGHVVEDLGEGSDGPMLERRILVEVRGARLSVDLLDQGSLAQPEQTRRLRLYGSNAGGARELPVPLDGRFELDLS